MDITFVSVIALLTMEFALITGQDDGVWNEGDTLFHMTKTENITDQSYKFCYSAVQCANVKWHESFTDDKKVMKGVFSRNESGNLLTFSLSCDLQYTSTEYILLVTEHEPEETPLKCGQWNKTWDYSDKNTTGVSYNITATCITTEKYNMMPSSESCNTDEVTYQTEEKTTHQMEENVTHTMEDYGVANHETTRFDLNGAVQVCSNTIIVVSVVLNSLICKTIQV